MSKWNELVVLNMHDRLVIVVLNNIDYNQNFYWTEEIV